MDVSVWKGAGLKTIPCTWGSGQDLCSVWEKGGCPERP